MNKKEKKTKNENIIKPHERTTMYATKKYIYIYIKHVEKDSSDFVKMDLELNLE